MTRRTFTKIARGFDVVKGITGKVDLKKREQGLSAAIPPQTFQVDCGSAGIQLVRVSSGQAINPVKLCKRAGGTYVLPTPQEEIKSDDQEK